LEIISCFWVKKTLFLRVLGSKLKKKNKNIPNLWKIWNLFYSYLSKNYEKMTLKSNFGNRKKLVPNRKPTRMYGLKFGMQGLSDIFIDYSFCTLCQSAFDNKFLHEIPQRASSTNGLSKLPDPSEFNIFWGSSCLLLFVSNFYCTQVAFLRELWSISIVKLVLHRVKP